LLQFPLVVVVTNAAGVPVAGVTVNFAVTVGGGTLSGTQSVTGGDGVAFTKLTVGSTGTNTVSASQTGLTNSPILFTASSPKKRSGQVTSQ
jgi:hypothetical protein